MDDERIVRQPLAALFRRAGFHVEQAAHGGEALELLTDDVPRVVVLDLAMPVMNGWQTLAAMESLNLHIKNRVVVFSGEPSPQLPAWCHFVKKPGSFSELLTAVLHAQTSSELFALDASRSALAPAETA